MEKMEGGFPTLETFSTGRADQSAARWLKSIELHNWPSAKKMLSFVDGTRLSGLAADWADQNPEIRDILSTQKRLLLRTSRPSLIWSPPKSSEQRWPNRPQSLPIDA